MDGGSIPPVEEKLPDSFALFAPELREYSDLPPNHPEAAALLL
jgi:hypothetical protein